MNTKQGAAQATSSLKPPTPGAAKPETPAPRTAPAPQPAPGPLPTPSATMFKVGDRVVLAANKEAAGFVRSVRTYEAAGVFDRWYEIAWVHPDGAVSCVAEHDAGDLTAG